MSTRPGAPPPRLGRRARGLAALASFALALATAPNAARACSVCGCGDPLVSVSEARPMSGRLRAGLDFEYLTMRARSDEDPTLTERLTQATFRPLVIYSPSERLNLVLQVPLVAKRWTLSGAWGHRC
jgi:hypothetical protein